MQLSDLYLISGVYFQEQVPGGEIGESFYTGILQRGHSQYMGTLTDDKGRARLFNVQISESELCFDKQYLDNQPHGRVIQYTFSRTQDGMWEGSYAIPGRPACGLTRCFLTPITEDFLNPRFLSPLAQS